MSYHKKRSRLTGRKALSEDFQSVRALPSFRLHVLARYSERLHEQHYKKLFGLNLRECRVLVSVGGHGEASLRQIREDLNLGKAKVSALVNSLVKRDIVVKVVDVADLRITKVGLTVPGRALHRALRAAAISLNEEWLSTISKRQRETFSTCLDILTTSVRDMRIQRSA